MFIRLLALSTIVFSLAPLHASAISFQDPKPRAPVSETYRIGDEWGKHFPEAEELQQDAILNRAVKATAFLGSATAFYLGTFEGQHVLATNHHVCETAESCLGLHANFTHAKVHGKITTFIGTWSEIDLALMTIELDEEAEAILEPFGRNFNFFAPVYPGQQLLTVGHGYANNRLQRLVVNYDDDCRVFSGHNEFRFISDPDELNPAPYKTWSFANGCDISHGDSGSAMIDKETGDIIGVIWTGRIPKSEIVQDSDYLASLTGRDHEVVWSELSYAVPAQKVRDILLDKLEAREFDRETAALVTSILAN